MSMPLRLRTAVRAFKTKASTAASKAASKKDATGGRDPYGLFKEAIASDFPDAVSTPMAYEEWKEHRASYSRVKMHEVKLPACPPSGERFLDLAHSNQFAPPAPCGSINASTAT